MTLLDSINSNLILHSAGEETKTKKVLMKENEFKEKVNKEVPYIIFNDYHTYECCGIIYVEFFEVAVFGDTPKNCIIGYYVKFIGVIK